MDAPTKAIVETVGNAGYGVMVGATSDGNSVIEATDEKSGEHFVVRAATLYKAVVELAEQIGIELEDG